MSDYYATLGVDRNASADEIKKAYRTLSKELHPDKNKGDAAAEQKFKEVNEAYEALSDPKKKEAYDRFGSTKAAGGGPGGFDFSGFDPSDLGGFSDIFDGFFGGGRRQRRQPDGKEPGADRQVQVTVEMAEAVTGKDMTIRITSLNTCETCDGSGSEKGTELKTCEECQGTGQVVRTAQSFFGTIQQSVICPRCEGAGKIPEKPCSNCSGEGRKQESNDITVTIPPGIDDGQTLRITGKGDAGRRGGRAGDLFVIVRVKQDRRFTRNGENIASEETISMVDAALGTEISVETVHGPVTLKIPAGTQPEQVMRIKGKGMPVLNSSRHGDHYVTVHIEIPKKLSKKEKQLLEEWKK